MQKQITFTNSHSSTLVGNLTTTENPQNIVIMVHGFSSSKNTKNLVRLSERLEEKGIASLRFDTYGHGESEGKFEDITITEGVDDILQAILYVKSLGYTKIGLLGSSFGGFCSIIAAAQSHDLSFLALKAPVSDYLGLEKSRYSDTELSAWKEQKYIDYPDDTKKVRLGYTFMEDMERHDGYASAKHISIPTLIVHGTSDMDVPYTQSQELVSHLSQGKLVATEGADHRYTNEQHAQEMLDTFEAFICEQFGL